MILLPSGSTLKDNPISYSMSSENPQPDQSSKPEAITVVEPGPVTKALLAKNLGVSFEGYDHRQVEIIRCPVQDFLVICQMVYDLGFNYLRCQCAYDSAPGGDLVSVYDLTPLTALAVKPQEIRLKVYLPRTNPIVPSVYWIWKTADYQERECFDMYGIFYDGHPNLKRILMPEDWVGYPMRKDYITPDFYELQDAY